jgi:dTDP-4-dehydrorhamnose reductase
VRVIVTGAGGQLARELVATAPTGVELRSVSRAECDITDLATVEQIFGSFRPDIVVNTAAYTAVDAAEENRELAFSVNARGAQNVAKVARGLGAQLIHISTDYVFDGRRSTPYPPDAPPNPISVYGATKAKGETLVLGAAPNAVVVRAGWLYSTTGKNFLVTILTALRASRPLSVVSDQTGCPTSAREFATAIWRMPSVGIRGICHWANSGSATWYDFAREIAQIAQRLDVLREVPHIQPVTTREYPRAARRPVYSVLDTTTLVGLLKASPSTWQQALAKDMRDGAAPAPKS